MPLHLAPGLLLHHKPHINNSQGPSSRARARGPFFRLPLNSLRNSSVSYLFNQRAAKPRSVLSPRCFCGEFAVRAVVAASIFRWLSSYAFSGLVVK